MNSWLVAYLVPASISLAQVTPWWSDQTAAWIGGIGGSLLGLNGALLGTLGGLGRARRLVLTLLPIEIGLGVLALIAGLIALLSGQPYAVWYPLLLGGGIIAFVFGGLFPGVRRRYREIELRKVQALDMR